MYLQFVLHVANRIKIDCEGTDTLVHLSSQTARIPIIAYEVVRSPDSKNPITSRVALVTS